VEALEQQPHPGIDEAQKQWQVLAEQQQNQAQRLQEAIRQKEEAVCAFLAGQADQSGKTVADNDLPLYTGDVAVDRLLERYDRKKTQVDALRRCINDDKLKREKEMAEIEERIRQVETKLDIDRIQRAEAANSAHKKNIDISVRDNLLRQQKELPLRLEKLKRESEEVRQKQNAELEKAEQELAMFQRKTDKKIAVVRNSQDASEADSKTVVVDPVLMEDPKFKALIAPLDQAIDREEGLANKAAEAVDKQTLVLHRLNKAREEVIAEVRHPLEQNKQNFYLVSGVGGAVFLVGFFLSGSKKRN
jgi:hypothetical protein